MEDIYASLKSTVGESNGTPLQYSCLENPMDGGAWWAAVHGVAEGRTWLGDFTFTFHFRALEKEMATHSRTLAWRIPWMEEPGGLQSMGSLRVGHDWATSLSLFTFMHWRRKWNPLQCSCLENPTDGGAWWASVCGVAQSRTWLKRLSSSSSYILRCRCLPLLLLLLLMLLIVITIKANTYWLFTMGQTIF